MQNCRASLQSNLFLYIPFNVLVLVYSNWHFFMSFYSFTVYCFIIQFTSVLHVGNRETPLILIKVYNRTKTAKSQREKCQGLTSSLINSMRHFPQNLKIQLEISSLSHLFYVCNISVLFVFYQFPEREQPYNLFFFCYFSVCCICSYLKKKNKHKLS